MYKTAILAVRVADLVVISSISYLAQALWRESGEGFDFADKVRLIREMQGVGYFGEFGIVARL